MLPFENLSPHPDVQEQRAAALWKLATGAVSILIAPVEAAALRLFDRDYYASLAVNLRRGEEIDIEVLTAHLASVGYTQMDLVEMPGQFTRRGGILDVYSPESDRPVRIEFFGDEIESIRRFDPETQRSQSGLDEAWLLPLTETPVTERLLAAVNARLSRERVHIEGEANHDAEELAIGSRGRRRRQRLSRLGVLLAASPAPRATCSSSCPRPCSSSTSPAWCATRSTAGGTRSSSATSAPASATSSGLKIFTCAPKSCRASSNRTSASISTSSAPSTCSTKTPPSAKSTSTRAPRCASTAPFPRSPSSLRKLMEAETHIVLAAANQGDVERMATVLREYQIPYRLGSRAIARQQRNHAGRSQLPGRRSARAGHRAHARSAAGVSFPDANLIVFGANDLSDEADIAARPEPKRSKTAAFVSDFRDLAIGDYVVHVEHGIAQYQGLKEIVQDGLAVEFMILEFAEAGQALRPAHAPRPDPEVPLHRHRPRAALNRLGSQQWAKTKARVRKAMQDMAAELLKLYAERHTAQGTAFSPDNEFQKEFEDSFDYNETDDQVTAIRAIKYDMESPTPMDRLLCGDVGYGKTEVAMRAAFKAVQDGKQVAVLTPTTVLSFQHFETFKRRFAQFPINVEMISRFRTRRSKSRSSKRSKPARSTSSSAPIACFPKTSSSRISACSSSTKSSASACATRNA